MAGLWHHDRVGNRLKAFVFLHDVDCDEGHPTEVAVGSHLLNYYRTDAMGASRFANDYVRDHYEVAKLCGAKGGGFVVDTHTLHRAPSRGRCRGRSSSASTTRVGEVRRHGRVEVGAAVPFRGPVSCVVTVVLLRRAGARGASGRGGRLLPGAPTDAAREPVAVVQA